MKLAPLLILLAAGLAGCEAKAPVARLSYVDIQSIGYAYHLKFASNLPILDLFKENKHQRPVLTELVCSLDADDNFDFNHRFKYFARGRIEFVEQRAVAGEPRFIFDSKIHFWESPKDEMGSDKSLAKEELDVILKDGQSVPCKVRMTVNFSSPYYSETMIVPAQDILRVARKRGKL
jgi:hypothetical protein